MSKLLELATQVDVLDVAGRVIANPQRQAVAASAAEIVALAHSTERFWAVCLEADLLVRALQLPIIGNDDQDHARDVAIQTQADEVARLMAAIRGETQPQE
ncbi:hypothetical protein [Mesorhizobium sp. KR1-2]|uniref:hypothetical protein n=1 Tax=Mesorhizobium sp. KR1-2 TaxID=3156609 RepID=UPI0032B3D2C5